MVIIEGIITPTALKESSRHSSLTRWPGEIHLHVGGQMWCTVDISFIFRIEASSHFVRSWDGSRPMRNVHLYFLSFPSFEDEYTVVNRLFTPSDRQSSCFVCLFFFLLGPFFLFRSLSRTSATRRKKKHFEAHLQPSYTSVPFRQRDKRRCSSFDSTSRSTLTTIKKFPISHWLSYPWLIDLKHRSQKKRRNVLDLFIFHSVVQLKQKINGSLHDLELDDDRRARWQSECRFLVEHPQMLTYPFIRSRPSQNI